MKLTGKAKEEFEKWYYGWIGETVNLKAWLQLKLDLFYSQEDSMKFGVYVDFADSVGIEISIINDGTNVFRYDIDGEFHPRVRLSRPEARTAAIEKFNEIFNNTN